jgi:hypothetical protein
MPAYTAKYKKPWGNSSDEEEEPDIIIEEEKPEIIIEDILDNALKQLALDQMLQLAALREEHDKQYADLMNKHRNKDAEPKPKAAEPKPKAAEPKPKPKPKLKVAAPKPKLKDAEPKPKLKVAAPKKPVSFARIMKDTAENKDDRWQQPGPNQGAWLINPNAWQQPKPQQPKPQQPKPQQPKPQQPKPQQPKPQHQLQPIRINCTVEEGPGGTPGAGYSCNLYTLNKMNMGPPCKRPNCTGRHANMRVNGYCIPIGWLPSHYSKNNIIMDTHTDPNGKGYGHKTCIQWFKHTVTGGYECNGTCGCMHECLSYRDGFKVPAGWRDGQWDCM